MEELKERCLELAMDTRIGLDDIMENEDYKQKLVAALDTDAVPLKKQVFELLTALCVDRPDGYVTSLETLQLYKIRKKRSYRFQLVVDELKSSDATEYTTSLVAFINCLIISPASLGERMSIRNEFVGLKILEVLDRFKEQCRNGFYPELSVQLDAFDEQRATDEGPGNVDLSSHMDIFFAILRQVSETPQEIPFLGILQHLLRTDVQQPLSEVIWETAETLVHRATLLESKQEADRLLRASNLGGLRCHCRQNSTEDGESTPIKKNKPSALCPSEGHPPSHFPWNRPSPTSEIQEDTVHRKSSKPDSHIVPQSVKANNANEISPSNGVNQSSNNGIGNAINASVISEDLSNGDLPPPPPPPACPPPPPPPPFGYVCPAPSQLQPPLVTLPQADTPKPKTKMKSFNWSKIPVSKVIGKDNLWSRIAKDHTGSSNDLDFDAMEKLFCQQLAPRSGDATDKRKKEIQEIHLLDGKRSLNINIFLKQFRSSIVRILREGAHEELGAERLRGLCKILPESDEVDLLRNFDGDPTKLGTAEKFLCQLIQVPSYKLRVESMLLKEEFLPNQAFLENSIEAMRTAAKELEECGKLHEVLYRVLVAGNFLNAGGYAGNAAGFKMLSLLKLTEIRANKPSVTLIHYVAEEIFKKRPDLLDFPDEILNLEVASKISMETLKTDVSSLYQRVAKVATQVAVADDPIKVQMQDFIEFAQNKMEGIQNDVNELERIRHHLADFLCEDSSTFKLEDCFGVFHSFCSRFKAAVQENERRRKQEQLAEVRREQREQQMALKRRSLELSDARSGADHIMDDICSGFPDDTFKRRSDPAMLEKCDDLLRTFKNRRSNNIVGGRRSFGSVEDSLESASFRRRKRVNGESRERTGSPQGVRATSDSQDTEMYSKLTLRSKINDWMLQNEKEQKRERELQLKLLEERKKRQLVRSDVEKNILEETEDLAFKQNSSFGDIENFKITKSALSRRSESFTQKIIGLIDATSNPFTKTRLYASTRESGTPRQELEKKSKDDSEISTKEPMSEDLSENTLDRFAPTRKTQRRLKLREMRIEAENINTTKQEQNKTPYPDSSLQTDSSSVPSGEVSESNSINHNNTEAPTSSEFCSENAMRNNSECATVRSPKLEVVATDTVKEGTSFNRQKNTSLRSRQSRLARRINSLSTPITSGESSVVISESDERKSEGTKLKLQDNICGKHEQGKNNRHSSVPVKGEISQNAVPKVNRHVSHKVSVSTETQSKVIISKSNANEPQTASSSKPHVQKSVRQNVKVQQTLNSQKVTQNRLPPTRSKTNPPSNIKQRRETQSFKNGSPLCNVKNEKTTKTSANKITIQHNGSVKFAKNNVSSLNSTPKIEKNAPSRN